MNPRLLAATAILSIATAVSAQTGRTMSMNGAPFIGASFNAVINYPPAVAGNIYAFLFSNPFPLAIPLSPPFFGDWRLDPASLSFQQIGIYDASGAVAMPINVPNNLALVGLGQDVQSIDLDIVGNYYMADNDLELVALAGPGAVEITRATTTSLTVGNNDLRQITNATYGAPVSYGQPQFSYLPIRFRGTEGYVEGYAGTFSSTSHNSDIDSVSYLRPGRRTANGAFQTIVLPNGYEIAIIRDLANGRQYSLTSYNRTTGATVVIPGSTWVDTSTTSTTPAQQNFYVAFSRDGVWGAIYVKDSTPVGTPPPFAPMVWAFRTDGSQPVIDITPAGTTSSSAFFDGTLAFTNDFLLAGGSGGLFWTSATSPTQLVPLGLPNVTSTNAPNVWIFPLSNRISPDGSKAYFQISSDTTSSRAAMDVVQLSNNGGVPQVINYTQFALQTGSGEFGYNGFTPSNITNSATGLKASVSPDGNKIAFLAATPTNTVFPGLYVADGTPNPTLYTVPGATYYSEVAFVNDTTVLFFAGAATSATLATQSFYKLDLTSGNQTGVITQIGTATDHRTRGQFWSVNRNFWYFIRSNNASNVNDIVGVDCTTGAIFSVTGTEFGTPGPVGTIRTGSFNTTADPWFALEMQLRRAPVGPYAYFTARREVPGGFEDANVFRFDMENGGQAVQLTNNVGTGAAAANVISIESLTISDDGNHIAFTQRLGIASGVSTPENVFHLDLTTSTLTQCSVPGATALNITDGSVRFTGGASPTGLVWSQGSNSVTVPTANALVLWAALGSTTPYTISGPISGTQYYQVLGTH